MLEDEGGALSARLGQALNTVGELTKRAQSEMRRFIFEWGPEGVGDGLVSAFARHVSSLSDDVALSVKVEGPEEALPLTRAAETQLYGIGREALANVVKHADADTARIRIEPHATCVILEIEDDGCGFDPVAPRAGHYGLDSMRSRAEEIGAVLRISSTVGRGTLVHVEAPVAATRELDGR